MQADPHANLPGRSFLACDIEQLIAMFRDLMDASLAIVRFDVMSHVQCLRFRVDNVGVRLLFTYCGGGTQWLNERYADRSTLGPGTAGHADEKPGLMLDCAGIHSISRLPAAILKGRRWPSNAERGAIHQLPPLSPVSVPRVLVAIAAIAIV
ncbi:DUF1826 domain-containing protein [Cupriavidus sp. CuC1]|uniref:DUF1826 domain-containing protein n=1 Tax=Cupriavidus sp. CuC1 TaxID=3373131 RepID=UPI0037CE6F96